MEQNMPKVYGTEFRKKVLEAYLNKEIYDNCPRNIFKIV
jgi:hypothetical protein